jgi:predicted metal-binding transcription factor (methanogenesis marker protein 9)
MPVVHKKKQRKQTNNRNVHEQVPCKIVILDNNSLYRREKQALTLIDKLPEDLLPVILSYIPNNIVSIITTEYEDKKYKDILRPFNCFNIDSPTFGESIKQLLDRVPFDVLKKFIKFGGISKYFSEVFNNTNGQTMHDYLNNFCVGNYKKCCLNHSNKIQYRDDYINYLKMSHNTYKNYIFHLFKTARRTEARTHDKKDRKIVVIILKNIIYLGKCFAESDKYVNNITKPNIKFRFSKL